MFRKTLPLTLLSTLLLFLLAACSSPSDGTQVSKEPDGSSVSSTNTSNVPIHASPTVYTHSSPSSDNTPGKGPLVIQTPTPVAGGNIHSQQVVLPDCTLVIEHTNKQNGSDATLLAISVTMTLKNTGRQTMINRASYYQLMGAEGDTFGLQSSATADFFGSIAAGGTRSGTIVFQVPAGVASGLRLLYRNEATTETALVPLNL